MREYRAAWPLGRHAAMPKAVTQCLMPVDCGENFYQKVRAHETARLGNSWWTLGQR